MRYAIKQAFVKEQIDWGKNRIKTHLAAWHLFSLHLHGTTTKPSWQILHETNTKQVLSLIIMKTV